MARNKYPEETIEKILDVAMRLFVEKGYEDTTIQDIVDGLGGLTKGAIYHHFKSKEEIIDAVGDRMFFENNPFDAVRHRRDLNGLEKLRTMVILNQSDQARMEINTQSIPILKNPRILVGIIESNRLQLTPLFRELIDEGIRDGSISTKYPKELSEIIPILTSLWMVPTVFPATADEMQDKFIFLADMLDKMGLPILNDEIKAIIKKYLQELKTQESWAWGVAPSRVKG